jgi:TetR/AcrR family transcriptional regulator, mexJK operon transcriptional repressor
MDSKIRQTSRGRRRRTAVLAAAQSVFLERGFGAATLDDVIRRVGGSRATLYAQFGGKEGLFAAIIANMCAQLTTSLSEEYVELDRPPEEVLRRFGASLMALLMSPEGLALYRVVIGESSRFPDLGRQVFLAGPQTGAAQLADYLRRQTRAGRLAVRDPELSARHFLEMVKGDLHTRALFGVDTPVSKTEISRCVREAVRIFVAGVQPAPQRDSGARRTAAARRARRS